MQSNSNFERTARNSNRNDRPPRGEQGDGSQNKQAQKRGKTWTRENDKRDQSEFFNTFA